MKRNFKDTKFPTNQDNFKKASKQIKMIGCFPEISTKYKFLRKFYLLKN